MDKQSQLRAQVLRTLAAKAGYSVGHVTPLENGRIAAEVIHDGDPATANLVAAWYGLLAKEPRVLAFHESPGGPDVLHTWMTSARRENVLQSAKELGVPHIHVGHDGRVFAWDQGRRSTAGVMNIAARSGAQDHQAYEGVGQLLGAGSGPQSAARSSYRNTIESY